MRTRFPLFCALLLGMFTAPCAQAQWPGDRDTTWGDSGLVVLPAALLFEVSSLCVQPDHKLLVLLAGSDSCMGPVVRLLPNGVQDPTFGTNGFAYPTALPCIPLEQRVAYDMALDAAGGILCAGQHRTTCWIVRVLDDGSPDLGFGINGVASYSPNLPNMNTEFGSNLTLDPVGRMLLTVFQQASFVDSSYVLRFLPSGQLDSTFGVNGRADIPPLGPGNFFRIYESCVLPSGSIMVVGDGYINNLWHAVVVKLLPDGGLDSTFGTGGALAQRYITGTDDQYFAQLHLLAPDRLLVHGQAGNNYDNTATVLMDTTGALVTTFGQGGIAWTPLANYGGFVGPTNSPMEVGSTGGPTSAARIVMVDNDFSNQVDVGQLQTDGTPDMAFGVNGIASHLFPALEPITSSLALDGCRIYVGLSIRDSTLTGRDVAVLALDACGSLPTGTTDGLWNAPLMPRPNPGTDLVTIPRERTTDMLSVYDALGRPAPVAALVNGPAWQLDVRGLPNGAYTLRTTEGLVGRLLVAH